MAAPPVIRLNANLELQRQEIADGAFCIVIDDFLANPEQIVDFACENVDKAYIPEIPYPGLNMRLDDEMLVDFHRFVRTRLARVFSYLRNDMTLTTGLSMVTFRPDQLSNYQRLCHIDPPDALGRRRFASLVYLFKNAELGGTAFYRWKNPDLMNEVLALENWRPGSASELLAKHSADFRAEPKFIAESNELAELLHVVPARFNRMVFYSGEVLHSAYITSPELLSTDYRKGRLTLNCFASVYPR